MYIFLKKLLRVILTSFMLSQSDKICEREKLNDEEIVKKYGEGTLIIKMVNIDTTLATFNFVNAFLVFCVVITIIAIITLGIFVPEQFQWKIIALLLLYIPLFIVYKIGKTIYETKKDIFTKENIIIRRAFKEDRIVTYKEIKQAAQSKKIKITKAIVYIPTNEQYIKIPLVDLIGDLAIIKIRQKSKIYIPEFTEKRKKYMGQASISGIFNFFGILLLPATLLGTGLWSSNNGVTYLKALTEIPMNMFALATIGCFVLGKMNFVLGQYKLRKDINDPEHVTIKLF